MTSKGNGTAEDGAETPCDEEDADAKTSCDEDEVAAEARHHVTEKAADMTCRIRRRRCR